MKKSACDSLRIVDIRSRPVTERDGGDRSLDSNGSDRDRRSGA
jgi:hypothetical protein